MKGKSSRWLWLALGISLCLGLCLVAVPGASAQSGAMSEGGGDDGPRMTASTFAGLELRNIGPALTSGRIADVAIHPEDSSTWYVAVGSGGVWKTTDKGTTWTPIFDDQGSYSIGCVTIDPNRPDVIWVGTGENVSGRHVGYGDGVYRSRDGGRTWENLGLEESEHIAKILVDPRDSNTVYVAAEGPLWSSGGDRGVYKTTDGGATWTAVLEISEDTGVTDLELDPSDPDTLYAAAYQRRRKVWAHLAGGPESGIYKSSDAGASWRELTTGLPSGDMGKIGLAVSPIRPEVVYATIEASEEERGFYRSADAGESWEKRNSYISGGTGPHYYQEIYADPHEFDRVYQMDVWIHVTDDGGETFEGLGEPYKHSDNHAFAFIPEDPDYILAGCDGGLYESWNRGETWSYVSNLPVTQIYKMALDTEEPFYNAVGGTQDNGTIYGPSRTDTVHGIMDRDWTVPFGADGYACGVDPTNPDILYVTWQGGNLLRYDRKTGEPLDVKPIPGPDAPPERWNWDSPFLISPHDPQRLYLGSQRLWRSDDRGHSWTPVSGDLTRAENRYELPMDETVPGTTALYDNGAMSWYATTTAITESPLVEGLLYVGTDDGLIQVSEDGGETWRRIDSVPGVPERSFVNDLRASEHDPDTVFAVFDNHKEGDFRPHLVKSTDRGRTWTSIAGDLPERQILWAVVQDHEDADLLFVAAEHGLWFTTDGGEKWLELSGGVPTLAFRDLEIQERENDLVGASFGRGFFVLDDYRALRRVNEEALANDALLFPVRTAELYVPRMPLRVREKGYLGASFFTAPNPPFGAVFTYYLREGHETAAAAREKREAELREQGEDVPFPGWESLREERLEEGATIVLTVSDADGNVIRRVTGPDAPGVHRVAWDLRYPSTEPTRLEEPEPSLWGPPPAGPFVTPGTYRVELGRMIEGELETLAGPESFEVELLKRGTLPPEDRREVLAFQRRADELQRKLQATDEVLGETDTRLKLIEKALLQTPDETTGLIQRAEGFERRLAELQRKLWGDPVRGELEEPTVPSVSQRVGRVIRGLFYTTSGPTGTQRDSLEVAERQFEELSGQVKELIEVDLAALEEDMEEAGAPWTPGRELPR